MSGFGVDNLWFIIFLTFAPLIFILPKKYVQILFFTVNFTIYAFLVKTLKEAAAIIFLIVFPYFYIKFSQKHSFKIFPLIIVIIALFIYLKGYGWILTPLLNKSWIYYFELFGLSYILFRIIEFVIQAHYGFLKNFSFLTYFNYLFSIWTLTAGPIQRYKDYNSQISEYKFDFSQKEILLIINRILNGYIKVLIIGAFANNVYHYALNKLHLFGFSPIHTAMMFYSYPVYLYMNFSGYCDIVIGGAKLAGFNLPENFNKPYLARNTVDFWNRWHISLSEWIRDYIYQPLFKNLISGFMKSSTNAAQYISIFFTFLVAGMWHGTSINFIIFGLLQGVGMVISMWYKTFMKNKLGKEKFKKYNSSKCVASIETFLYFHYTCISFVFIELDMNLIINKIRMIV